MQAGSATKAVRASWVQWERWQRAAEARGLTRNGWVRRSLDEAAELDLREADELAARREARAELKSTIGGDAA